MEQFKIPVNKFWHNLYKRLSNFFLKKARKTESLVIDPISVKFPTPHCVIIKFNIVNRNQKYEIVKQGDWKEWYTDVSNNPETIPKGFDVEMAIRHNFIKSYKIS